MGTAAASHRAVGAARAGSPNVDATDTDPLAEATALIEAASDAGIPIRLVGGLAVRYLTPDFPPREREGQDMDLASVASMRAPLSQFLSERGFVADTSFNALHGRTQLYFVMPDGTRALDVILDQLNMSHVLDFRHRIVRMPYTLDVSDLLLSKLQIVELNEKDLQDILYLLAAFPIRDGDEPGTIATGRIAAVIGQDWGWWRTVTGNLDRIAAHGEEYRARLVPPDSPFDPIAQAAALRAFADDTPKSLRWRLRSRVGERVRWYELPEEVEH